MSTETLPPEPLGGETVPPLEPNEAVNAIPAAEPEKPVLDWLDGSAPEPEWPKDHKAPTHHICDGCGKERPVEAFDLVDHFAAGQYVPLVRCDECRAKRPVSSVPYDDRGLTKAT